MIYHSIERQTKYVIEANDEMVVFNNGVSTFKPRCIQINSQDSANARSKDDCVDVDIYGTFTPDAPEVFLSNITQQGQAIVQGFEVQCKIVIKNNKDEAVIVSFC